MIGIKNGLLHDAVNKQPMEADILIDQGKIVEIGKGLIFPDETEVIDASGLMVYPGFIDAHSHIGLSGYGIGYEGDDINEINDIITPQLWAVDGINPQDPTFLQAALGGVTCVGTGPGSANVIGGKFTAIKTSGVRVDDMIVKPVVAMKCAFGENPKRVYKEKCDHTRMTTAAKLREMLSKTKEYIEKSEAAEGDKSKKPAYDMKLEALIPVIKGEIPLKAHAHRADDILTAIRIAKEFQVKLTLEHCTEGHLIAEELAKEGYPIAVGPTFGDATKFELRNKTFKTPSILADAGCQVSIITDAPVIPQQYLALCAGFAVKAGMDEFEALKSITINPAKHLGIEASVGSLEIGKDADIVITNGNPFLSDTVVVTTLINGKKIMSA